MIKDSLKALQALTDIDQLILLGKLTDHFFNKSAVHITEYHF